MTTQEQRLNILYGDVLNVYGVPHDDPLLRAYGNKIFDKRTRLHKIATKLRREQLIKQYKINL